MAFFDFLKRFHKTDPSPVQFDVDDGHRFTAYLDEQGHLVGWDVLAVAAYTNSDPDAHGIEKFLNEELHVMYKEPKRRQFFTLDDLRGAIRVELARNYGMKYGGFSVFLARQAASKHAKK
ncbi:MAG: hypothetical protein P4L92_14395 [Rudaea sp.]|nr:hypothetical protein [Rudaea sp.]